MVSNVDRLPTRPHLNKVNTTGAISWATNGGYESPNSDDGVGPATPMRPAPSTFACPSRASRQDARTLSDMERGFPGMRPASLNDLVLKAKAARGQISIKDRIACIQWNWFTMTMVCPISPNRTSSVYEPSVRQPVESPMSSLLVRCPSNPTSWDTTHNFHQFPLRRDG
jgi:hypothetical protein